MAVRRLWILGLAMAVIAVTAMAPGGDEAAAPAGTQEMNKADLIAKRNALTKEYRQARNTAVKNTPEAKALNDEIKALQAQVKAKTAEMNKVLAGNAELAAIQQQIDDVNKQVKALDGPKKEKKKAAKTE